MPCSYSLPLSLPPSGYTLRKKQFFSNFWTILFYAVGGTLLSTFVVGGLTYGLGKVREGGREGGRERQVGRHLLIFFSPYRIEPVQLTPVSSYFPTHF